jgi:hypothetical protein
MSNLSEIATKIIHEQELIIGPVAWDEASKISEIHVIDRKKAILEINPESKEVIDKLVSQYEHFFGEAAREACKDAVSSLLADMPQSEVPESLR